MNEKTLLEVSNYPVMYKKAWDSYIGFVEKNDPLFPCTLDENEVDVLSFFGLPVRSDTAVICASKKGLEYLQDEAYHFGLELGLNDIPVSFGSGSSVIEKAFRTGFLDGEGQMEYYLDCGLMDVFTHAKIKRMCSVILAREGCIYSPFHPDKKCGSWKKEDVLLKEYLATRKQNIILLGLSESRKDIVESALMSGAEIYVHSSFISSFHARIYAREGARIITSARDYIAARQMHGDTLSYPDCRGYYHYNGRSYSLIRGL